jgi:signal transduction histidine kinase
MNTTKQPTAKQLAPQQAASQQDAPQPGASGRDAAELRVLLLLPTLKDATLTAAMLGKAGLICHRCSDLIDLCRELERGVGAAIIAEEEVAPEHAECLKRWLDAQPPWSDLPLIILARYGADSATASESMHWFGNVTLMERPTRVSLLVSTLRSALRGRERQYQIRDHLLEKKANEESLRELDRRKDEFLAILAHELRNPLAPIRNSIHILSLSYQQDPASAQVCEVIERQVNHMVRLVDDLLDVSRVTRNKIELKKESLEVASFVRSAVEASRPLIDSAGHQLALSLPVEPLTIEGDFVRLTQVVANLLNNAAKYTDAGGQIWLSVKRDQRDVVISVRDSGSGIAPEHLPHVFDLFMQVDHRAARSQGGLGIGLTLVKSLIELHGGTLSVDSRGLGHGSEFQVRIPLLYPDRPDRLEAAKAPSAVPLTAKRILVVDDNKDAASSLGLLLRVMGATVKVVYSGPAALEAVAKDPPSIVLLDIGMPEMDGYEVARQIRAQKSGRDITLIALTGWGQDSDRKRTQEAGFDHHLVKPAEIDSLQTLLLSVK